MSASLIGVLAVTRLTATALAFGASSFTASAQPPEAPAAQPEMRENCPGLVATGRPPVAPAAFRLAALNEDQVRLTFIGHASFLIETLDRQHGNAIAAWESLGRPEPPTPAQTKALREAAWATQKELVRADGAGNLDLHRMIAPWSLVLLKQL